MHRFTTQSLSAEVEQQQQKNQQLREEVKAGNLNIQRLTGENASLQKNLELQAHKMAYEFDIPFRFNVELKMMSC